MVTLFVFFGSNIQFRRLNLKVFAYRSWIWWVIHFFVCLCGFYDVFGFKPRLFSPEHLQHRVTGDHAHHFFMTPISGHDQRWK